MRPRTGTVKFALYAYGIDMDCEADIRYYPATRDTWDEPGDAAEVIEVTSASVTAFGGTKVLIDLEPTEEVVEAIGKALNENGAEDYDDAA